MKSRNKTIALLLLAVALAIGGFASLMMGRTNHVVAVGVSILCFVGFFVFFNKGYEAWEKTRAEE